MSDANYKPDGTGVVMGDTRPMPDRGTGTGMTGIPTDLGGYSINVDATNRMGGLSDTGSDAMDAVFSRDSNLSSGESHYSVPGQRISGTNSDPMPENYVDDPAFGAAPGDAAEDRAEGY